MGEATIGGDELAIIAGPCAIESREQAFAVAEAVQQSASDIHFEPEAESIRLRYRLDGLLHDVITLEAQVYKRILSRVKVLSKMKLNITKAPQDGRFTIHQSDVDIEVRVSVLPSEYGESIVMRLLDPRNIHAKLEELGMRPDINAVARSRTGCLLRHMADRKPASITSARTMGAGNRP